MFSRININQGLMVNTIMFANEVAMFRDSVYGNSGIGLRTGEEAEQNQTKEIRYSIPIIGSRIQINPTPLTRRDFDIGGCDLDSESEDEWDGELSSLGTCLCVIASVHKATIPIARLREMVDADDVDEIITYRCPTCTKCIECKGSNKLKARSLQESVEQSIIERSVEVDLENNIVKVDLPFLKDPVKYMTEKHGYPDNHGQARRVYQSQCKKTDNIKQGMRKVHAELVEKGFMMKLSDMPEQKQKLIDDSKFRHYYIWRTVAKEDSISTPVRMVVDPTMSSLNIILAKGENRLGRILDILIAIRTTSYAWSSDISKLYNMLHLKD